jgi:hypothetical protein
MRPEAGHSGLAKNNPFVGSVVGAIGIREEEALLLSLAFWPIKRTMKEGISGFASVTGIR